MSEAKFNGRRIARITINVILIFLVIYANIFAVKAMTIYAVEVMTYERLFVAYDIGGMKALRNELAKMLSHGYTKRELQTATGFRERLGSLKDPGAYLKEVISEKKKRAIFLNNMRRIALVLIVTLLAARVLLNIILKR